MSTALTITRILGPLVLGLAFGVPAAARQDLPSPPPRLNPVDLPLQSLLYEAEGLARVATSNTAELKQRLKNRGLRMDDRRRIHVTVVSHTEGLSVDEGPVTAAQGEIDARAPGRLDAWVPVERLTELAGSLPRGLYLERVNPPCPMDEGPAVMNSITYRNGGANGAGRTVGIIDGGYQSLTAARNAGVAPPALQTILLNYTGDSFETGGVHGTACVETVFDHAPGAHYRIYKIDSVTDIYNSVANFNAAGGHVLSHSLGFFNTGWADNTGTACDAANLASNNGVLFFTAAGNQAQTHWQGNFNSGTAGVDWHDWVTGDQSLAISLYAGGTANLSLCWNNTSGTPDFDLYLYDASATVVLASSTNVGSNAFEFIAYTNNTGSSQTVNLAVYRRSGASVEIEAFMYRGGSFLQYIDPPNSVVSPCNASGSQVMSIGAVNHTNYGAAPGSDVIVNYSAHGPTNSGVINPDLVAPTSTNTFAYGGGFGGTSCATPNAAGLATALWSADPQLDASAIRFLLREQADAFRDWGLSGYDQTYGRGGAYLADYHPGTIWLTTSNRFNNPGNARQWPQNSVAWAQFWAPSGGRLAFLPGGSYAPAVTLFKALRVESFGGDAVVGN